MSTIGVANEEETLSSPLWHDMVQEHLDQESDGPKDNRVKGGSGNQGNQGSGAKGTKDKGDWWSSKKPESETRRVRKARYTKSETPAGVEERSQEPRASFTVETRTAPSYAEATVGRNGKAPSKGPVKSQSLVLQLLEMLISLLVPILPPADPTKSIGGMDSRFGVEIDTGFYPLTEVLPLEAQQSLLGAALYMDKNPEVIPEVTNAALQAVRRRRDEDVKPRRKGPWKVDREVSEPTRTYGNGATSSSSMSEEAAEERPLTEKGVPLGIRVKVNGSGQFIRTVRHLGRVPVPLRGIKPPGTESNAVYRMLPVDQVDYSKGLDERRFGLNGHTEMPLPKGTLHLGPIRTTEKWLAEHARADSEYRGRVLVCKDPVNATSLLHELPFPITCGTVKEPIQSVYQALALHQLQFCHCPGNNEAYRGVKGTAIYNEVRCQMERYLPEFTDFRDPYENHVARTYYQTGVALEAAEDIMSIVFGNVRNAKQDLLDTGTAYLAVIGPDPYWCSHDRGTKEVTGFNWFGVILMRIRRKFQVRVERQRQKRINRRKREFPPNAPLTPGLRRDEWQPPTEPELEITLTVSNGTTEEGRTPDRESEPESDQEMDGGQTEMLSIREAEDQMDDE